MSLNSLGALDGIRVLDATQMLAGPICGMRLGDLGADVIKIEPPINGENNRRIGFPGGTVGGQNTTFLGLNRNKRSVALDLKDPGGLAALHDLVKRSDVFVQNYKVGTAERIGAGYARLAEINPRLVYCSISGYGEEGPYARDPGQDLLLQGYSGSMWSVGTSGDAPQPGGLYAVDAMTGYQAVAAILAALIAREKSGQGQKVEVSMLAVTMDCQAQELCTYLNKGHQPVRTETPTAHPWMPAPYGVFPTADSYITLAMPDLKVFAAALGDDQLLADLGAEPSPDEMYRRVSKSTRGRDTASLLADLRSAGLWCGPVYDYEHLCRDPHVVATGMIVEVPHPTAGPLRLAGIPIKMSQTPTTVRLPPPLLGEHTREVLRDVAGYSEEHLNSLMERGAVAAATPPATA